MVEAVHLQGQGLELRRLLKVPEEEVDMEEKGRERKKVGREERN